MFSITKNQNKMFISSVFTLFILLMVSTLSIAATEKSFSQREDVQQFIDEMATKHNFDKEELTTLFDQVEIQQEILDSISNPKERKPWYLYRNVFFSKGLSEKGVNFWNENSEALAKAEDEYGVPASIIVSILGVETLYGKFQGKYRVIDSLSTLAFEYPPRSKFFRSELEEYLLLTKENKIPATRFKGSYAGAIGQPQFMPSSYRYYAVDFSGSHTKDLQHNTEDAIGSVANYLKKHGWEANQPVAIRAKVKGRKYKKLNEKQMKPAIAVSELASYGITPEDDISNTNKVSLLKLDTQGSPEFWLGLQNFYAITRYNPSVNYAMVVYQLSEEINKLKSSND